MSDYRLMAEDVTKVIDRNLEELARAEEFLRSLPQAPSAQMLRISWDQERGQVLVEGQPWQQAKSEDLYYCGDHVRCLVREVLFQIRDGAPAVSEVSA